MDQPPFFNDGANIVPRWTRQLTAVLAVLAHTVLIFLVVPVVGPPGMVVAVVTECAAPAFLLFGLPVAVQGTWRTVGWYALFFYCPFGLIALQPDRVNALISWASIWPWIIGLSLLAAIGLYASLAGRALDDRTSGRRGADQREPPKTARSIARGGPK